MSSRTPREAWLGVGARVLVAAGLLLLSTPPSPVHADAGYRDFHFGTSVNSTPTGEKPESKLWWNDGSWWGCLWDPGASRYSIYRLDLGSQSWVNIGTPVDPRKSTKCDALWDGTRLYIVSHVFTSNPGSASTSSSARLYRYRYEAGAYVLDAGFPVLVNSSKSEALVLAKDSTGQLWITWVQGGKVKVNRSLGDDWTWGTPFDLPTQGNATSSDDISGVVTLGGAIGILWSNQSDGRFYFSTHLDGSADGDWQPREDALADAALGQVADDHLNVKLSCDLSGNLYAVVKTGLTESDDPLIYVLRRQATGEWSRHVFGTKAEDHTRPILCIDGEASVAYVFAQSDKSGRGIVYMKSAGLADLQFPPGMGTPFIESSEDRKVNNPTTGKHCVGGATGIVVLASDEGTRYYLHNYLPLGGDAPVIASFSPTSGTVGTEVTISGSRLTGATEVAFNGTPAGAFVVDSPSQIRAVVPAGATTGRIRVTTPDGVALSPSDFTVIVAPTIASFDPGSGPVGTEVTLSGEGFSGTTEVAFAGVASASFAVDHDGQVRAPVPSGAGTGKIRVTNAAGSGESAEDFVVTEGPAEIVLQSVHDAQVRSASPDKNYGQLVTLRILNDDPTFYSYVKFDVPSLAGTVQEATLRLFVVDPSDVGGAVHPVSNHYKGTTTDWTEDGITWNNAPPIELAAVDSLGPVAVDTWAEFDVTAAVMGSGPHSFVCRSRSTNSAYFSSGEGSNPPELRLRVAASSQAGPARALASTAPASWGLHPVFPNPFRLETGIAFELPRAASVRLVVYDMQGRLVRRLVDSWLPAGRHEARWDGRDGEGTGVPNGVYFVRLEVQDRAMSRKVLLLR
jgi:hypothetical protein